MVMRIGGLASGMDIDSIVEKLMQAEKAPLNKLYQAKQKYEWQRDAYRDVNKKLKAFDDFLLGDMTLQKDMYKKTVQSSNAAVSAIPTTATNGQTFSIDSVSKLATSGKGTGTLSPGKVETTKLSELDPSLTGTQNIKLEVLQNDGTMKSVQMSFSSDSSISDIVSELNNKHGINAFYDKTSGQLAIASNATGKGEFYQDTTGGVVVGQGGTVTGTVTGSGFASIFVSEGMEVFSALGYQDKFLAKDGENAELTINGAKIERSSNTFDLNGFKVTLNDTYNGSQPITLTTKTDSDNMVDKIKKFVETYNGLVESFTATTKETKYRDFPPLTDEQKEDMSEDEIKVWEQKAKSGTLRGDSLVRTALSGMRSIMYGNGGNGDGSANDRELMDTLYKMGITTSNKMSDNGKLVIDENKLRATIEADPDAVFQTFSNIDPNNQGIVQKLRASIDGTIKNIEKKAGRADAVNQSFNIGRNIVSAENRIDTWKAKLGAIESRYWKQFSAMETAINKANQQSSIFATGQ